MPKDKRGPAYNLPNEIVSKIEPVARQAVLSYRRKLKNSFNFFKEKINKKWENDDILSEIFRGFKIDFPNFLYLVFVSNNRGQQRLVGESAERVLVPCLHNLGTETEVLTNSFSGINIIDTKTGVIAKAISALAPNQEIKVPLTKQNNFQYLLTRGEIPSNNELECIELKSVEKYNITVLFEELKGLI